MALRLNQRFCAFCRSERKVYLKRHSSLVDILGAVIASVALSLIIWQDLDLRALLFFAFAIGVTELFISLRWRMSLPCPHCGFDPLLYKRRPDEAARRVEKRLEERALDPRAWLSPLANLPKKRRRAPSLPPLSASKAPHSALSPTVPVKDVLPPV